MVAFAPQKLILGLCGRWVGRREIDIFICLCLGHSQQCSVATPGSEITSSSSQRTIWGHQESITCKTKVLPSVLSLQLLAGVRLESWGTFSWLGRNKGTSREESRVGRLCLWGEGPKIEHGGAGREVQNKSVMQKSLAGSLGRQTGETESGR